MFEQASIESSGLLKRPWVMTVSFAGQAVALSAVVLVSLVHTDSLVPRASYFTGVVGPVEHPPNHDTPRTVGTTRPAKNSWRVFTAPIRVPKGISTAGSDAPLLSQDDLSTGTG